jgi:adenine phosphoribosyltransferase
MSLSAEDLRSWIRDVPDFPKPGILFRDITPILKDHNVLARSMELMVEPFRNRGIEMVLGIESRGFLFGPGIAAHLEAGFAPVRKKGKLPPETIAEEYSLEYGTDIIEIRNDAVDAGMKVLVVDDLIATGGTAAATVSLLEKCGAKVEGLSFLVELADLQGRACIPASEIHSVIRY